MNETKFKAAIFDLDGTLANTIEDLTTGLNLMLEELSLPLLTVKDTLSYINCGAKKMVGRCIPEDRKNDEALLDRAYTVYLDKYDKHYLDKTRPYDHEIEQIGILKENGCKLAVVSNKQDVHTKKIVEELYGKGTFDYVIGHDPKNGFPTKPDPQIVFHIIKELGVSKDQVAYFGDSDIDMQTGKNAGLVTFGVAWGFRPVEMLWENGADFIIGTPEEISGVLLNYKRI